MIELSIIIPTFKPLYYIEECINSILGQDYDLNKIEVVIVLNGVKEPYFEYIKSIKGLDKLVCKIFYSSCLGVSNARNMGLEYSEGRFIVFLDDDDTLSSNFVSIGLSLLKEYGNNIIIQANSRSFNEVSGELIKEDYIAKNVSVYRNIDNSKFSLYKARSFFSSSCFKIIPREIIGNNKFENSLKVSEDALFMFSISKHVTNLYVEKSIFYNRRIREGSTLTIRKSNYQVLKNSLMFIAHMSKVYFSDVINFSFVFYLSRIAASFKFLIINLLK
ncbi:hypothetical protein AS361_05720 [Myroides marinus]|uniref:glycosyltransferase family 2 protein n=1 Tax=Myroides marinus TaxID=703342 RepID=UPI000741FF72|nr:glycosyltransferase family 2 protein [Myroides marinus]KUF42861.1 hypothetical protein AS361_05720 [Myroides marinus]